MCLIKYRNQRQLEKTYGMIQGQSKKHDCALKVGTLWKNSNPLFSIFIIKQNWFIDLSMICSSHVKFHLLGVYTHGDMATQKLRLILWLWHVTLDMS